MDTNPYAPPCDDALPPDQNLGADSTVIRHRRFVGKTIYFSFRSLDEVRDEIRCEAERFINAEVGVENVVSVSEHAMTLGPFTVVVWYRAIS